MTQENSAAAPSAAAAGDLTIGADLRVHRLGFGAMRLTGKGIWGPPTSPVTPRPGSSRVALARMGVALAPVGMPVVPLSEEASRIAIPIG